MKKIFGSLFIILCLLSCDNNSSNSEISEYIKAHCDRFPCTITMQDVVKEKWDKMYIFTVDASLDSVNKVLGFEYDNYFEDIGQRMIFTKGSTVIYHEDQFPSAEVYENGELVFKLGDSIWFKEYTPHDAAFTVNEVSNNNGKYYLLKHQIHESKVVLRSVPIKTIIEEYEQRVMYR